MTRIIETFIYADIITGSESDLKGAQKIPQAMLTQGQTPNVICVGSHRAPHDKVRHIHVYGDHL